ncbi:hypothetical protein TVAG_281950 [Trichomonas vaginalis G3]|uniref:Uncharacterized protein n=1 Tax=Trichomonas vaginalis (strain ATCC PRA-98 / G3) TaxID=412133 RepID=A2E9R0_TRIV3|nr:DPP6 N-terminal domain-like family [Trichomonas vaginalis G3]EAY10595.1 hypothetical protein TVAG_281950 [Trichomonas vaginalis G3]KAI5540847.1 DPP6 N-terminal domain-like family [Trichomonas vaginalis G3]|eukprot:XP_001322818.1 hypothetical protein [Trichomonas vaginalis G3]
MFLFTFLVGSVHIHYIEGKRLSKKTSMVTLQGSDKYLAIGEVSDSISRFPPRLNVYSIGTSKILSSTSIQGQDASLGYAIAPIKNGFIASSPQAAFRWGKPGPILTKIYSSRTIHETLNSSYIPYGETLAASLYYKFVIACSPFENKGCYIINETHRIIQAPDNVTLFGIAVAVSPSGRYYATMSRDHSRPVSIHIFNSSDEIENSFKIVHNPLIDLQQARPYLHFDNDNSMIAGFPEIGKVFSYKRSTVGWVTEHPADIEMTSISKSGSYFITVNRDGEVKFFDNLFKEVDSINVQRSIKNSNFTKIVGGDTWFAVLEDDGNERTLHIYSTKSSNYFHALFIVALLLVTSILYIIMRPKISISVFRRPGKKLF